MLTKVRAILIADYSLREAQRRFRFEGIEIIHEEREIEQIWRYNKTPLMLKVDVTDDIRKKYICITVPKFHLISEEDFIDFCHENGIECGEYMHGTKIDTSKEHCFLCNIANYGGEINAQEFNRTTEKISDTIIYESKNFFVKVELGCLNLGMLMINPKTHYLSMACLPEDLFKEYQEVKVDVQWLLKAIYGYEGTVIFFEHGSAPDGMSSHQRSIVHAHTHVCHGVTMDAKYIQMVSMRPVKNERVSAHCKYFSYQEGYDGKMMLVNNPRVYVQRQYPRQVIGERLGIPNELTSWRKEAFMGNVIKTFDDFYKFLTQNNIPCHIRERTQGFVTGYQQRLGENIETAK